MPSFETIDVAIGMALLFLSVSLLCTALREALEGVMKTRAADLERGIRQLLREDDALTRRFYEHPLIYSLFQGEYKQPDTRRLQNRGGNLPSYIPSGQFARALMDLTMRGEGAYTPYPGGAAELNIHSLRAAAINFPNPHVRQAVLSAIDHANGDLEAAKANLQAWFDGTMDRVSGWYKRRTQLILFIIGILLAGALNIDSIEIAERLGRDKALRAAVVAHAEQAVSTGSADAYRNGDDFRTLQRRFDEIGFPIGWRGGMPGPQTVHTRCASDAAGAVACAPAPAPRYLEPGTGPYRFLSWGAALQMVTGWLLTAVAVMLGAPFWFDALNKLMVIRSTVKPTEKSPDEASEDRQRRAAKPATPTASSTGAAAAAGPAPANAADVQPADGAAVANAGAPLPFTPNEWRDGHEGGVL